MLVALLIGTHMLAVPVGGIVAWRGARRRSWSAGRRAGVDLAMRTDPNQARQFFQLEPLGVEKSRDR